MDTICAEIEERAAKFRRPPSSDEISFYSIRKELISRQLTKLNNKAKLSVSTSKSKEHYNHGLISINSVKGRTHPTYCSKCIYYPKPQASASPIDQHTCATRTRLPTITITETNAPMLNTYTESCEARERGRQLWRKATKTLTLPMLYAHVKRNQSSVKKQLLRKHLRRLKKKQ